MGFGEEGERDEKAKAAGKAEAAITVFVVVVTDLRDAILFLFFFLIITLFYEIRWCLLMSLCI